MTTSASAGFACFRDFGESRADLLARGLDQRDHVGIAAGALQTRVDIFAHILKR